MSMSQTWRIGAVLLLLGGVLEAGALGVGSVISAPATTILGASLLYAYPIGLAAVGVGLIATGVSLPGPGRVALRVAGVIGLIGSAVDAVQSLFGAPLGPGPAQAAYLLYVICVVVAAGRLLSNSKLSTAARWSIAVPAMCFVLVLVTLYLPPLQLPGSVVFPWLGTAAAGLLLLRSRRQPNSAAVLPIQG